MVSMGVVLGLIPVLVLVAGPQAIARNNIIMTSRAENDFGFII
jgi:hypothetical protein